ncbi:MAG: hypothetical protein A2Y66_02160 [Nitrospirae bacterium RBG_13_41_22]|nr:MAG: hypothetical protein A2Y66_02160 [Nitrospirae bacterium RBG_13_41_22]
MKRIVKIALGLIVSITLIYFAFKNINLSGLMEIISKTNILILFATIPVFLLSYLLRAFRWRWIIQDLKNGVGFGSITSALFIGTAVNNLMPLRAGEVTKAYIIGKKENVSKSAIFATVLLERIIDGLTIILFLLFVILFHPLEGQMQYSGIFITVVFFGALVFFYALLVKKEKTLIATGRLMFFLPGKYRKFIMRKMEYFVAGLMILKNLGKLALLFLLSITIWLVELATFWMVAASLGLEIPLLALVLALVLINIGIMLPSSPAYIGNFEFFGITALASFGIANIEAASFSVVLHAFVFSVLVIFGLFYMWKEGYKIL